MIPQNQMARPQAPGANMIQNALMGQRAPQANQAAFQNQQAQAMMGFNRPPQGGMIGGPGPAPMGQVIQAPQGGMMGQQKPMPNFGNLQNLVPQPVNPQIRMQNRPDPRMTNMMGRRF